MTFFFVCSSEEAVHADSELASKIIKNDKFKMTNPQLFIENFLTAVDFQDPVEVTLQTVLAELPEWDSLAALGVIVMFDIEYGKTIIGDDLKACNTLEDLYKLLG